MDALKGSLRSCKKMTKKQQVKFELGVVQSRADIGITGKEAYRGLKYKDEVRTMFRRKSSVLTAPTGR